jgi:hypothetical protein
MNNPVIKFTNLNHTLRAFVSILALGLLSGCVGTSAFQDSARQVNFNGPEGKTGWSKYEQNAFFRNVTEQEVYDAAKDAMGASGFALIRADLSSGIVLGEHGMTIHDWNIMAAVYFKREADGVRIRVQAEGSKDVGFSGDVTGAGWTGSIINTMRNRLGR